MKVPFFGVRSFSAENVVLRSSLVVVVAVDDKEEVIHLEGRQIRESEPQYRGWVCKA